MPEWTLYIVFQNLQNKVLYSFQLMDIPLSSYVAASTLGMLPTAILNCYMGTTLRSMNDILTDETNQTTGWIVLIVQVGIIPS